MAIPSFAFTMLIVYIGAIRGWPTGAPQNQCVFMQPRHGSQSTSANPYIVTASSTTYSPGDPITVAVSGNSFKGLVLQARAIGSSEPLGIFSNYPANTRGLKCGSDDTAVTHSSDFPKPPGTSFVWTPPSNLTSDIEFVATIAAEKYIWWRNTKSASLSLFTEDETGAKTSTSTMPRESTHVTEPTASSSPITISMQTPHPSGSQPVQQFTLTTCNAEADAMENQQCYLFQDSSETFDWTRNTGRTPSGARYNRHIEGSRYPVTGPERARTGSYYMFVEASGRNAGDRARLGLRGDDFSHGGTGCLRFFYNMNGFHIGQLSVYSRLGNLPTRMIWAMSGDQKQNWNSAAVELDMERLPQIGFEVSMTGQFSGDIAIDDVKMSEGPCEPIPEPFDWICSFEISDGAATMCSMEQPTTDQFDWTLRRGNTPSAETGPESAYNGDFYIYTEASKPRETGDTADILIPQLQTTGDVCLEFRYNLHGYHSGSLQVFTSLNGLDRGNRWDISGDQGLAWSEERVTIEELQIDEQIGFRGAIGTGISSDIALDDIRVTRGRC